MSNPETSLTETEILEDVLDLLSDPGKWTQGSYGKTSKGTDTWGNDPNAVSFCLLGAIQRVTNDRSASSLFMFISQLTSKIERENIVKFNDDPNTTHEDVVLFLKTALYQMKEGI